MGMSGVKLLSILVLCLAIRWGWNEWDIAQRSGTFVGKTVVICGASAGIGEQTAYRYSEQRANVVLVARREEELRRVQRNCETLGAASVKYIMADLSDLEGAELVLEKSLKHHTTIDVLVLNHVRYDVQRWNNNSDLGDVQKMFNVNTISYINLATLFLPSLQKSRGRLVVVSSGLGVFTYPYFALYCANKYALHGFFNVLRQDLAIVDPRAEGMTITLVVLGAVDTKSASKVSQGNPVAGDNGWTRVSEVDASVAVVKASLRRDRQAYYPLAMIVHEMVSFHFPSLTEKLIRYVYGLNT